MTGSKSDFTVRFCVEANDTALNIQPLFGRWYPKFIGVPRLGALSVKRVAVSPVRYNFLHGHNLSDVGKIFGRWHPCMVRAVSGSPQVSQMMLVTSDHCQQDIVDSENCGILNESTWMFVQTPHVLQARNSLHVALGGPLTGPIVFGGRRAGVFCTLDLASISL